jgi:hypothetical protein
MEEFTTESVTDYSHGRFGEVWLDRDAVMVEPQPAADRALGPVDEEKGNDEVRHKKVLIISFSQSGQLTSIVTSLLVPLCARPSVEIVHETISSITPFPFPWSAYQFLDVFPESFQEVPCSLEPLKTASDETYDLVIIAYQVWYLSPSIPISSFLQSPAARVLLNKTAVVTVVGCRNMWVRAHNQVKDRLRAVGAELVGHIVLTDRSLNLVSAITIVAWMLTGKRRRLFGLFPKPGISEMDIARCSAFGEVIADLLAAPRVASMQDRLNALGACNVVPHLLSLENVAARMFKRWSTWIMARGGSGDRRRRPLVLMFGLYLILALALASPLSFLLFHLMAPFRRRGFGQQAQSIINR